MSVNFDAQETIIYQLGQLVSKVDSLTQTLSDLNNTYSRSHDDLDGRVNKLERNQTWLTGVGSAVGFMLGMSMIFIPKLW